MNTTLKNAVDKLCSNPTLWQTLGDVLMDTENEDTILEEGEVVEVQAGNITISFTWDMITAVNNKTNNCIDLMTMATDKEIVDFFKSVINSDPDSCEYCPFVDYKLNTRSKSYCIFHKELKPNNHHCDIPVKTIREYTKRRR